MQLLCDSNQSPIHVRSVVVLKKEQKGKVGEDEGSQTRPKTLTKEKRGRNIKTGFKKKKLGKWYASWKQNVKHYVAFLGTVVWQLLLDHHPFIPFQPFLFPFHLHFLFFLFFLFYPFLGLLRLSPLTFLSLSLYPFFFCLSSLLPTSLLFALLLPTIYILISIISFCWLISTLTNVSLTSPCKNSTNGAVFFLALVKTSPWLISTKTRLGCKGLLHDIWPRGAKVEDNLFQKT